MTEQRDDREFEAFLAGESELKERYGERVRYPDHPVSVKIRQQGY